MVGHSEVAAARVKFSSRGLNYVYVPKVPREIARRSALRHVVETFFEGSTAKAVSWYASISSAMIRVWRHDDGGTGQAIP